jgi:hypothetical protein
MELEQQTNDASIVAEINRLHGEVWEEARLTITKAIRIGELLVAQKEKLTHGEWLPWIKTSLKFGQQQVSRYVNCFNNRHLLDDPNYASRRSLSIATLARGKPVTRGAKSRSGTEPPETDNEPESGTEQDISTSAEQLLDQIEFFADSLLRLYRKSDSAREKLDALAEQLLALRHWLYRNLKNIDPKGDESP